MPDLKRTTDDTFTIDIGFVGPPVFKPHLFTRALKPDIPWETEGTHLFSKTVIFSNEIPCRIRLGFWHSPDGLAQFSDINIKPQMFVLIFALDDPKSLEAIRSDFDVKLREKFPGIPRVLLGINASSTRVEGRTNAMLLAEREGFKYYYETDLSVPNTRRVVYQVVRESILRAKDSLSSAYKEKKEKFREFEWKFKKEHPPPQIRKKKGKVQNDPRELEEYRRQILDAWQESQVNELIIMKTHPVESPKEESGKSKVTHISQEDRRQQALEENYFTVEDAKRARWENQYQEAIDLFKRSIDLCTTWDLYDGIRWANQQIRELEELIKKDQEKSKRTKQQELEKMGNDEHEVWREKIFQKTYETMDSVSKNIESVPAVAEKTAEAVSSSPATSPEPAEKASASPEQKNTEVPLTYPSGEESVKRLQEDIADIDAQKKAAEKDRGKIFNKTYETMEETAKNAERIEKMTPAPAPKPEPTPAPQVTPASSSEVESITTGAGGIFEVQDDGSRRHCPKCGNDQSHMIKEFVDRTKIINPYPVIYGKKYKCGECGAEWRYVL